MNLITSPLNENIERGCVELFLKNGVSIVDACAVILFNHTIVHESLTVVRIDTVHKFRAYSDLDSLRYRIYIGDFQV